MLIRIEAYKKGSRIYKGGKVTVTPYISYFNNYLKTVDKIINIDYTDIVYVNGRIKIKFNKILTLKQIKKYGRKELNGDRTS